MRERTISLQFPLTGLRTDRGFQAGPGPYATNVAFNVRGKAASARRLRGGSRPGLDHGPQNRLGSPSPVRLLTSVRLALTDDIQVWSDSFDSNSGSLGTAWARFIYNDGGPGDKPTLFRADYLTNGQTNGTTKAGYMIRSSLPMRSGAATYYQIDMFIAPYLGVHRGKYQILARMDDSNPVPATQSIIAEITPITGGTATWALRKIVGGLESSLGTGSFSMTYADSGWFSLHVSNNDLALFWNDTNLSGTVAAGAMTGVRVGLGLVPNNDTRDNGGYMLVDSFRVQYQKNYSNLQVPITVRNLAVASAGGRIYREYPRNCWLEASTTRRLASGRNLQSAQL